MGGHGALVLALRRPDRFRSVSALAPICQPSRVPWGTWAFSAYLGPDHDTNATRASDPLLLIRADTRCHSRSLSIS